MKYKLIIDKNVAQEEIIAIVHGPSSLTQQIENLVRDFSGADSILGYREDEMRKLVFSEISCVTGLDRKVIAMDAAGNHYRIQEAAHALEETTRSVSEIAMLNGFDNISYFNLQFKRSFGMTPREFRRNQLEL
jgi:hypothetical protein